MRAAHDPTNLTVFHLRKRLFGMGRFHAGAFGVRKVPRQVRPLHIHLADRVRFTPPCDACRPQPRLTDPRERKAWPFDTAFPSALPPIPTHAGQLLTDVPSAGAQRAKPSLGGDTLLAATQSSLTTPKPGTADHLGKFIDVLA